MKPILRDPSDTARSWSRGAALFGTFAAGLVLGGLSMVVALVPLQPSDGVKEVHARPDAPNPGTASDTTTLAMDLARIEGDSRKENKPQGLAQEPPQAALEKSTLAPFAPPRIARRVDPVYPRMAKSVRIQGPVDVKVHINERGFPARVTALNGNLLLKQAALDATKKWRFHPALADGQPVPSEFKIHFNFKLA